MTDDYHIKVQAVNALYGLAGPTLLRVTAARTRDGIHIQVLYLDGANEEEVERYRAFCTDVLAALACEMLDEDLVPVTSAACGRDIPALEVRIYCVHGAEAAG